MSKIRYYYEISGRHSITKPLRCSYNNLLGYTSNLNNRKVDRAMRKLKNAIEDTIDIIIEEANK